MDSEPGQGKAGLSASPVYNLPTNSIWKQATVCLQKPSEAGYASRKMKSSPYTVPVKSVAERPRPVRLVHLYDNQHGKRKINGKVR